MAGQTGQCALIFAGCRSGGFDIDRILWEGFLFTPWLVLHLCEIREWLWGGSQVGDERYIELPLSSYCLSYVSRCSKYGILSQLLLVKIDVELPVPLVTGSATHTTPYHPYPCYYLRDIPTRYTHLIF